MVRTRKQTRELRAGPTKLRRTTSQQAQVNATPPAPAETSTDLGRRAGTKRLQSHRQRYPLRSKTRRAIRSMDSKSSLPISSASGKAIEPPKVPVSAASRPTGPKKGIRNVSFRRDKPFRFLDLPPELRNEVYSYLLLTNRPAFEALFIIERRIVIERQHRELNLPTRRRYFNYQPYSPEQRLFEYGLMTVCKQIHREATGYLYARNWFHLCLERFESSSITIFGGIPLGWRLNRIRKLILEVKLKDAAHMNHYVDWKKLFDRFPELVSVRIVPSFHPTYHAWARHELESWKDASHVFQGFFALLALSVPNGVDLQWGMGAGETSFLYLEGFLAVDPSIAAEMAVALAPLVGRK